MQRKVLFLILSLLFSSTLEAQDAFYNRLTLGGATPCVISTGTGAPNTVVTGNVCDVYYQTDGLAGQILWLKESGTGNTGWIAYTGQTFVQNGIAVTSTDAVVLTNNTAATAGVPVQISPRLRFRSEVWNTTATAATNTNDFWLESVPVSGTTPSGLLKFGSSLNGAGATFPMTITSGGMVTATTFVGALTGNSSTVTTNANLTGPITSVGNATSVAAQTGSGSTFVMNTSPTLVTPALGVATATTVTASGIISSTAATIVRGNLTFNVLPTPAGTASPALAGAGAGNLSNGAYKYIVTYVTSVGQTNYLLGNLTSAVTVVDFTTNGQVLISSIPTDATGTATARKLYRTLVGGVGNVYLVTTLANNTTTTFTDNVSDATLLAANVQAPYDNTTAGWIYTDATPTHFVGTTDGPNSNTGLGLSSFASLTSGYVNTMIGAQSSLSLTSGFNNTMVGAGTGKLITTGTNNTAVGFGTGAALTTADQTVLYGYLAGQHLTSGGQNVFVGSSVGQTATTAAGVTAMGQQAFQNGTTATLDTIIGEFAGFSVTTASNSVMLGYEAGYTATAANATTTGGNNTWIGHQAGANAVTQFTNSTALGYQALATASNQVSLGNPSTTQLLAAGNLIYTTVAPVRFSGFGTNADASFATGSTAIAFDMNIGTGGVPTTGVLTMPTAAHGWICSARDITTPADQTYESAYTVSTVTLTTTIAWTANDHLYVNCEPF